jgi:TolB-like protein/DNA-binding winged helix-turn-helix (wHTH) protein/Tfp pilus assembly protein PilF
MPEPGQPLRAVRFGAFEADFQSGELRKHGLKLRLQDQPFQILAMLLERRGEMVTREELHQRLWPTDTFVDFDHGLNNAINRLREVLGDSADSPRFVETLPRRGYRFIARVDDSAPPSAHTSPPGDAAPVAADPATIPTAKPATELSRAARKGLRLQNWRLIVFALAACLAIVVALNPGGLRQRVLGRSGPARIQSIAVLPLENLTGDPSQEYFADGMTDGLTTELAQVSALRVISRTSAVRYKGEKKPLAQIARELKVGAVVEGSVKRAGEHVWITVQLIDTATDRHLWARSYERDLRDIATLQSEVARDIAGQIQVQLTPQEQARMARPQRMNSEAYDLYLRALLHAGLENREDNQAALDLLEQAVGIDRNFAAAYAALAHEYRTKAFIVDPQGKQWEEKAFGAVEKALSLDPELAEAYVARGDLLWSLANHYPHEKAALDYRRAIALNPNLAEAHHRLAVLYVHIGLLDKGLEEAQKAVALDPRNTGARFRVGISLLYQGKYEESLTAIRDSQRFLPSLWAFQTAFALFQLGRRDEAAARVNEFLKKYPEDTGGSLTGMQALLAAAAGDQRQAEELIQRAIKMGKGYQHFHHTEYIIASAYALMNKTEPAMKYLQMAAEDGFPCYPLFERDANLNNLRKDPHFVRFMADLKKQWEHYKATL